MVADSDLRLCQVVPAHRAAAVIRGGFADTDREGRRGVWLCEVPLWDGRPVYPDELPEGWLVLFADVSATVAAPHLLGGVDSVAEYCIPAAELRGVPVSRMPGRDERDPADNDASEVRALADMVREQGWSALMFVQFVRSFQQRHGDEPCANIRAVERDVTASLDRREQVTPADIVAKLMATIGG